MKHLLAEFRRAVKELQREVAELVAQMNESDESATAPQPCGSRLDRTSRSELVSRLTPQQKRVYDVCLQSGPLTYQELGQHLGMRPISAKNLVNRMFQDSDKRALFRKETVNGTVELALSTDAAKELAVQSDSPENGEDYVIKLE